MASSTRFGLRSRLIFCECEREDCPATQCRAQSKVLPPMLPVATTACIETWSVRVLRDARRHGSACCDTGRCVRYAMAAPAGVAALRLVTGNTFLEISSSSAINSRGRGCNNVQPKVIENRVTCAGRCFDAHANEQNHGSLARTAKAFRSGNWSAKRAAPAAERCSCAVLECRLSMRFAVTCQGELTRSRGSMQHSNTGFDPERSYALVHYGIQINARQRSNNISHSTREDVCACGLVAPVTRNPQRR